MLDIQSVMGYELIFDNVLRAELRGGLRAKLMRGCVGRAAGQITALQCSPSG